MSGSPHGVFGGVYAVAGFAGALAGDCAATDTDAAATTAARSIVRLTIRTSPQTLITVTSSFTAAADFLNAASSSAVSLISMIFSSPFAPSLHGTPTNR